MRVSPEHGCTEEEENADWLLVEQAALMEMEDEVLREMEKNSEPE